MIGILVQISKEEHRSVAWADPRDQVQEIPGAHPTGNQTVVLGDDLRVRTAIGGSSI